MSSKRPRRRGVWRWIYSGMHCIGQIERDHESGGWRVYVAGKLIGAVGSEEVAMELVKKCARSAGDRERGGQTG
jgi:hypothetical protein